MIQHKLNCLLILIILLLCIISTTADDQKIPNKPVQSKASDKMSLGGNNQNKSQQKKLVDNKQVQKEEKNNQKSVEQNKTNQKKLVQQKKTIQDQPKEVNKPVNNGPTQNKPAEKKPGEKKQIQKKPVQTKKTEKPKPEKRTQLNKPTQNKNATQNKPLQKILQINSQKQITVLAKKPLNLTLTITQPPSQGQKLFIIAQSPFNDPFEQPIIVVRADNNYQLYCDEQGSNFVGICQIGNIQLKVNRTFTVQFQCEVDCDLLITTYLSKLFQLTLANDIKLSNPLNKSSTVSFTIQIPSDTVFTQYYLVASPENPENSMAGTTIVANYGKDPILPTIKQYKIKAQPVGGHNLGIFISGKQVKAGDKVYFLALLPPHGQFQVNTNTINGKQQYLTIGVPVYDFTSADQSRIYTLDISQLQSGNVALDSIIQIKFITYSGSPAVTISTDKAFLNKDKLVGWINTNSQIYQITPQLRKSKGNFKQLYIMVKGYWACNYYLSASINQKSFIDLQYQVMQGFQMQPDSIKNLIFQDINYVADLPADGNVQYKIDIISQQSPIQFMIKDCEQKYLVEQCLITKYQDISKPQNSNKFAKISLTKQTVYPKDILRFNYNVAKQCMPDNLPKPTKYTCRFHIFIANTQSNQKNVDVQIQINKDTIKKWLRQGKPQKDTVAQSQINYYAFQLNDITDITKIEFYLTIIQGDALLLVSRNKAYPTIQDFLKNDNDNDIRSSTWNAVVIGGQGIKVGTYHIGVYGDAMTDYSISVAISRAKKNKPQTVTQIILDKGQPQTVTMPQGKQNVKFIFTPLRNKQKSIIKINQIQGSVTYQIADKAKPNTSLCNSNQVLQQNLDSCKIETLLDHYYAVTVDGDDQQLRTFTILYTNQLACNIYPWDYPLKVLLYSDQQACMQYSMNQLYSFHVYVSLSPIQLLTSNIQIQIQFQKKVIKFTGQQIIVTKKQLQLLCSKTKKTGQKCKFNVNVIYPKGTSQIQTSIQFYIAVQGYNSENVLFEQIPQKITTNQISTTKSNNYYYFIYKQNKFKNIQVILTSETLSNYQVLAKIVYNQQFVQDIQQQLYPKFNSNQEGVISVNSSHYSHLTILTVPKQNFANSTEENVAVLLICVYGVPLEEQSKSFTYVYKIEVNQGSVQLQIGQTKFGNIYLNTAAQYDVNLKKTDSTMIQIRSIDNDQCVKAYMTDPQKSVVMRLPNNIAFSEQTGTRQFLLKTDSESCAYQISYDSLDTPISNIFINAPHSISLTDSAVKYFTYYHTNKISFYILQMVSRGTSYIYVQPLNSNSNVKSILKKDLDTYRYKSQLNGHVQISFGSFNFCFNCYYIIAVKGFPDVNGQITINPGELPIFLKEEIPLKDHMLVNQTTKYQFYSQKNYSVLLTVLVGQISAKVLDPKGNIVGEQQIISNSYQFQITVPKDQSIAYNHNYFDDRSRYIIVVTALDATNYYIQAKKSVFSLKSYEGVPLTFQLTTIQENSNVFKATIQFSSLTNKPNETLNFLVQDLNYFQQNYVNSMSFQVFQNGNIVFLGKITQSEGSYNIQVPVQWGSYNLTITASKKTNLTVLMAKRQFAHLVAGRNIYIDKPSVFQVFSPGDALLVQIFSCSKNLKVKATSTYKSLWNDSTNIGVVNIERENLGGHYVVYTPNIFGQFFILVSNLNTDKDQAQNNQLSYQITYHLFNTLKGQVIPYKQYDIESLQISYRYNLGGITFILHPIQNKNVHIKSNQTAIYKIYISNSSAEIERVASCSLGYVATFTVNASISDSSPIQIKVDTNKLKQIIGPSEVYFVGAEATLKLNQQQPKVKQAYYVYEISQLVSSNEFQTRGTYIFKVRDVLVWIVLPFLIGCIILYFAVKYLIRNLSAYPTQLVEEEAPAPESENGIANKEAV